IRTVFYRVANVIIVLLLRVITRYEVIGRGNIPNEGPFVVVANHTHLIDPPILGASLPRKVIFMAKVEAFRAPIVGLLVRAYEAFPVRRGQPDRNALRMSHQVLESGLGLAMFPEGTRSRDGALRQAFPGAALVAARSRVPVIPVSIDGTDRIFPTILRARRPHLRIVIGAALPYQESNGRTDLKQMTDQMMRAIAALLPPSRRGVYCDEASSGTIIERQSGEETTTTPR
ncbi:MAG TPA: lysophospholipid acyltransferase family protein, partial [Chloroflexota bacterium]|nr:lysophospholipid acyltransferase family protein [Chloroflexota bacterium]